MKGETDATIYRRSALRTAESKDRTLMPEENALQPDLSFDELRFLTTLWETRSLTTAAARHRISMGSASRRLAHLREVFNDELFVRSGLIMLPTGRMRALYPRVESVLRTSLSLFSQDAFDLANTRRIVRILSVDNGVMTLMNEAIGRFYQSAPNASIAIRSIDDRLFERLREGEADMALFPIQNVPKDFHVLELYKTRRGLLVREGHPLIERYNKKGCITLEDLSEFRKIDITFSGAPPLAPDERSRRSGRVPGSRLFDAVLPRRAIRARADGLHLHGARHHAHVLREAVGLQAADAPCAAGSCAFYALHHLAPRQPHGSVPAVGARRDRRRLPQ